MKETHDERKLDQLKLMHRNALRLLNLVNQLLDFRKNEVAGLHLNLSEGEVVSMVILRKILILCLLTVASTAFGKEKRASHFFLGNRIAEYVVR